MYGPALRHMQAQFGWEKSGRGDVAGMSMLLHTTCGRANQAFGWAATGMSREMVMNGKAAIGDSFLKIQKA